MKYLEARITITPNTEEARDLLAALAADSGFESFTDSEDGLLAYIQADLFNEESMQQIFDDFPIRGVEFAYDISEVEDKNWNESWEQSGFDPIEVGDECIIYDAKDGMKSFPHNIAVGIEARLAFGTGNHATTQMAVAAIIDSEIKGKRVLDCGCGTGILSIVAKKCGADDVVAYDIDDWSVKNAEHNAELNEVQIDVIEGDRSVLSHTSGVFDVVVANINRNIIVDDMPHWVEVMHEKARFILSGFYIDDVNIILEQANRFGFRETRRTSQDSWCCLVLDRD